LDLAKTLPWHQVPEHDIELAYLKAFELLPERRFEEDYLKWKKG